MSPPPAATRLPAEMTALVLPRPGEPLEARQVPVPRPGPGQVLLRVAACGVCRTDLHLVDAELPRPKLPVVPGHEVVGRVAALGPGVEDLALGDRLGVGWLGATCGACGFCRSDRENLCDEARFTGYTLDGGYAEYAVVDRRYAFRLPDAYGDVEAAPLLCAGFIGYRSYRLAGPGLSRLGVYGFGAAAHLVTQVAHHEGVEVYAFTRPGDRAAQAFAREMGACWAGGSDQSPPAALDAAILFAPVGALVPRALAAVGKGGTVVCGGIHMSDLPGFPYELLWGERVLRSVANLTRADGEGFLALASRVPLATRVTPFPLGRANEALAALRAGAFEGAAVLVP